MTANTTVGTWTVLRVELRKLAAQKRARFTLLGCLIAPFIVTIVLKGQQRPPKDTLYGRHIHSSGFAVALFVLTFVSQWVLPFLTAIESAPYYLRVKRLAMKSRFSDSTYLDVTFVVSSYEKISP